MATVGGLFAVMTFIHFFVDWICQTHAEAMVKHNNWKVRARHCLIYTCGFVPFLLWFHISWLSFFIAINILFWSHFCEDTYVPVFLWAKYIRRPPQMTEPQKYTDEDGYTTISPPDPKKGFVQFIDTTLGKILMIAVDQIIHLAFLFPIIYLIMRK